MKVLILAYDFPPSVRVGGFRPNAWLRYLGEFGVDPVVVTRQWDTAYGDDRDYVAPSASSECFVERAGYGVVIRVPHRPSLSERLLLGHGAARYRLARKALSACYELGQYLLPTGTKRELYRAAHEYLRHHQVDAILATGEPFVLFRYGAMLSTKFGVPWIADYRDPWSHDERTSIKRVSRRWEFRLERKIVRTASAVTTVCESLRELLQSLHGDKPVYVVRNGYDPEAIHGAQFVQPARDRMTITFVGTLYPWDPIRSVLAVCDRCVRDRGPVFELRLVLLNAIAEVAAMLSAEFPALAPCVQIVDRMPNNQAAIELARANALLLFNPYSFTGTRIYDYLAVRRRVLLCYSQDDEALRLKEQAFHVAAKAVDGNRPLERLVEEARAGVVVRDARHLEVVLEDLLDEFDRTGAIVCEVSDATRFSRRTQARVLAEVLKQVCAK